MKYKTNILMFYFWIQNFCAKDALGSELPQECQGILGWRDGSEIESVHYSSRGSEFNSQHPGIATHSFLLT